MGSLLRTVRRVQGQHEGPPRRGRRVAHVLRDVAEHALRQHRQAERPKPAPAPSTHFLRCSQFHSATSRAKLGGNRSTGLPREKECCPANPGSAPRLRTVLQAGLCSPPTDGRQKMIAHVEQNASEPRIAPPRALRRSSHRSTAASARRAWALSALSAPLRLRGGRPEQVSPPRVSRWARPSSFWSRRV